MLSNASLGVPSHRTQQTQQTQPAQQTQQNPGGPSDVDGQLVDGRGVVCQRTRTRTRCTLDILESAVDGADCVLDTTLMGAGATGAEGTGTGAVGTSLSGAVSASHVSPCMSPEHLAEHISTDDAARDPRLELLRRIVEYRNRTRHATVDVFHQLLLSLGGRSYWALVACLCSVQVRDLVALQAVDRLMKTFADSAAVHAAPLSRVEECVSTLNYCKTKAKNIKKCTEQIRMRHGGRVPFSYSDLIALYGVGPKIAHLMRSVAFGHNGTGIVVSGR